MPTLTVKPTYALDHAELWHCADERFVVALPHHVSSRVMREEERRACTRFETRGSVYVVTHVHPRTVSSYAEVEAAKTCVTDADARV